MHDMIMFAWGALAVFGVVVLPRWLEARQEKRQQENRSRWQYDLGYADGQIGLNLCRREEETGVTKTAAEAQAYLDGWTAGIREYKRKHEPPKAEDYA